MVENAIIGGTGVYRLDDDGWGQDVQTPYGTVRLYIQRTGRQDIAFLPRHGRGHSVPPHRINFRANIKALEQLGVKRILATAAVGSLNHGYPPGSLVMLDQFIDFTKNRDSTFFDGEDGVAHVDMAMPYCPALINALEKKGRETGVDIKGKGTYICVEGPRFETRAEIKYFRMIGGDVVGMTNVPEVVLARELGLCYGAVGIVTNWCNGMVEEPISHHEILEIMKSGRDRLMRLFTGIFSNNEIKNKCSCRDGIIRL